MQWNIVAVKAAVHAPDTTPTAAVDSAATDLAAALDAAAARTARAHPGVVIDLAGTVRTEADVRAALGLPPARTDAQRIQDAIAAVHYPVTYPMAAYDCGCDPGDDDWDENHTETDDGYICTETDDDEPVCFTCRTEDGGLVPWRCATAVAARLPEIPAPEPAHAGASNTGRKP